MQESPEVLIQVEDLSLTFEGRKILENVQLKVHRGEIVTIIGPNGAGKSCLVKCLLQLLPINQGKIQRKPHLKIGYTPQRMHIDVTLPLTVEKFLKVNQKKTLNYKHLLHEVGVSHLYHHWMYQLSGGELQRVLLARALSQDPDLLVLDEPAQGVDLIGQNEVYHLLAHIRNQRNCGILIVSHDLSLVMAEADMVICLNHHICCSGRPEVVKHDPAFRTLFGIDANSLALYTHNHDHHHTVEGDVTLDKSNDG